MQSSNRTRNLVELYDRQKYSILGVLTKAETPAPKKASVMISIAKICKISAEILEEMRQSGPHSPEMKEAQRIHHAWQDLLLFAWEATMVRKTDAA